jgi:hypothetical protein
MSYKKTEWAICIGFDGQHLAQITPEVERLKKQYPKQEFRIYNSKFPQYTFLLVTFAETRDQAHKIGLALVKKELPQSLNLCYWCKEIKSLKDVVQKPIEHTSIQT